MKTQIVILLLILGTALNLHAQTIDTETNINVQFENITLKESLDSIARTYNIRFSYSDSRLNTSRLVSGNYRNMPLNQFLKEFLVENNINYSIIDQQIVLFPFNKNQTIKIFGKVINELDGSPIPFANIALPETGKGTSANEVGEFEIALTRLPSEVMISHLSFEKKLVYVYDDQSELSITLRPAQKELKEVTIKGQGNKNAYYNLVKKAYNRLNKRKFDDQYGKAFYRQKSSREDRYTEIFEMFYDVRYSTLGIQDWAVQEGRYAFQKDDEYDIFLYNKNFTLLSRMFPLLQPETESYLLPVNPDVKKYFDLSLNEIIRYENRYIAILDYSPKPIVDVPAPVGQLYIDFEDYSILKFKGHFTDSNLEIIGFSDKKSNWENYRLDFEVSFIDDHSDNLHMDYIKIDHNFDYFYNKNYIGKINTSSFLTFYEQYSPAKNKKLGGPIDFKTSDMDLIDRVGYNPIFWKQNPIVRRTPIENKLIMDFDQNEAFGAVFMNNDEEVVLLPDNKEDKVVEQLVAKFEARHNEKSEQEVFLRLDKPAYLPEDKIRFSAYVFSNRTFRPMVTGSVLTVNMKNDENEMVLSNNYDITDGAAYGEIPLNDISKTGKYTLEAYTNDDIKSIFKIQISISPFSISLNHVLPSSGFSRGESPLAAEGGAFLAGVPTRIAYTLPKHSKRGMWKIVDQNNQLIQNVHSNGAVIGSFTMMPDYGKKYFMLDVEEQESKIPLPEVLPFGMSISVDNKRDRSLKIRIYQKPSMPNDVFVLSTFKGKVLSISKTRLVGHTNTIELPAQYLRPGINDLAVMDTTGKILAERRVFQPQENINIELISSSWKSKRSNRLQLELKVSDKNGRPIKANLSAICFHQDHQPCHKCDIRNEVLLQKVDWGNDVDFDKAGDSLFQVLDNLLILDQNLKNDTEGPAKGNGFQDDVFSELSKETLFAEVSVSGSLQSQIAKTKKIKPRKTESPKKEIFWIPKLNINEKGIAILELKVPDKNQAFSVNIQGISDGGIICNTNLIVDPSTIKNRKKTIKKRRQSTP